MVQPGAVMRVPVGGGAAVYTGSATNTPGIASDGTFAYWTQYAFAGGQIKANYAGQGGQESILVDNLNSPYDLAVDSASVFWVEEYPGNVKQVSMAGGTPLTLASGLANPTAIAVDSASVYWLEYNYGSPAGGVLRKAPKQSPAPVVHVTVQTTIPGTVYMVDGNQYQDSPQMFDWVPGSTHTLTAYQNQFRPAGGQYQFTGWSDGGSIIHNVSPSVDTTYTAIDATQFNLAVLANGQGTANAASTGYQNQGQSVAISATPNPGYTFVGWVGSGVGSYTGTLNNVTVTMNDLIIQSANSDKCSYALASSGQGFVSNGGSSSVSLTVLPGCSWQATNNVPWIAMSSNGTGSGSGSITYSVAANTSGVPRTGTLTIGGQTFTVTQSSVSTCSYSATQPNSPFSPTGGIGVLSVGAGYPCSWTASAAVSWITIQNGSTGAGNGSVDYLVAPNVTGATRVGTITVAGQAVTITQSGMGLGGPLQFPAFHDVMNVPNFRTVLGLDGSLIVAYAVPTGGLQLLKSADGGATFSPPVLITDSTVINGSFDIAADSSNSVHVTWWGNGGTSGSNIYYARSSDGGASFGPPLPVPTGLAYGGFLAQNGAGHDPKVISDGLGNVFVAYPSLARDLSGNPHGGPIWISISADGGGTFQPEVYANVPDGNNYYVTQLLAQSGSLFMVALDATNEDSYFYHTTVTPIFHTFARINQVLHKGGPASVAIDPNGATIDAAYLDFSVNSGGDIDFAQSPDGGTTWGSYRRVNTSTANQRSSPIVLLDASGGLHFLWSEYVNGQPEQASYSYSADHGASFSASASIPNSVSANYYSPQAMINQAHALLYVFGTRDPGEMVMTSSLPVPVLQMTKSHSGNVTMGQSAVYNISVNNVAGAGPTVGTVTVTENAPAGLTLVSMSGTGWACPNGSPTCTRNDSLTGGSNYPVITATFNVAANASSPLVNSVGLSGGGSAAARATDTAIIVTTSLAIPELASPSNGATGISLTPSLSWNLSSGATSYDVYFGISATPPLITNATTITYNPGALVAGKTYYWRIVSRNAADSASSPIYSFTTCNACGGAGTATHFVVTPSSFSAFAGVPFQFTVRAADAGNSTVTNYADPVHFTSTDGFAVLPGDTLLTNGTGTFTASLSSLGGQTLTASDLLSPGITGTSPTINVSNPSGLRFVPLTPCRVLDTRLANGPFGGPFIAGGTSRDFIISNSSCGIPSTAQAFSLNAAVVPHGSLGFLTVWPTGLARPQVATLNSLDGRIKSNAAIAPAGTGGAISVFGSNDTDVILDINGYFVPSNTTGSLAFYPITPCRLVDTRNGTLINGAFTGGQTRTLPILSSSCNVPSAAQAYSLNFVVVPPGRVGFITAFPTGVARPSAATLNDITGTVAANAAIVPAGTSGSIDVFASDPTNLVVDINGYFAPPAAGGLSLYNLPPCRVLDTRQPAGSLPFSGQLDINVFASGCGATPGVQAYVLNATVVPQPTLGVPDHVAARNFASHGGDAQRTGRRNHEQFGDCADEQHGDQHICQRRYPSDFGYVRIFCPVIPLLGTKLRACFHR